MQNIQAKPSLGDLEQELSELNTTLRRKIGEFLGREVDSISLDFIARFNEIREDVLSKLPGAIESFYIEKKRFELQHEKQRLSQTTTNKSGKRKLGKFPVFSDPKLPTHLLLEERKKLLEFSSFLSLELDGKKIPEDVLIRATIMIQKRAIAVLENREDTGKFPKLTQDELLAQRDQKRWVKFQNFAARNFRS